MSGPLASIRVLELGTIGPAPYAAMLLADMGAEVLRLDRVAADESEHTVRPSAMLRGRRSVAINLRRAGAAEVVLQLAERADVLLEGMRPGVAERLGIGPAICLERNSRLIYGRMTGWGQDGPYATLPGHDINYIALAGILDQVGRAGEPPLPPINLAGDFAGGGAMLAFGIACALLERQASGCGQVIDAAMIDGSALLGMALYNTGIRRRWNDARGTNTIDSGAFFYDTYETADGTFIAVGAIEPEYYQRVVTILGVADDPALPPQADRSRWPEGKAVFARAFRTRTRDEWCALFDGVEACITPVLSPREAPHHPHNRERRTFVESAGVAQPSPAPRLSVTPGAIGRPPPAAGQHTDEALREWGFHAEAVERLKMEGVVA